MKRLLFLLTLIMGLGCLGLHAQNDTTDPESKAKIIKTVVQNKKYIIYCDKMYPQRGRSRYVGREYTVEMKGDKFRSYLPYMGVAHSASYSGMNIFDFEEEYTNYKYKEDKKGNIIVSFRVQNGSESMEYTITFYPNGKVNIHIQPMKRDSISFSGELGLNRKLK